MSWPKGKHHTPETREKLSATSRAAWSHPEYRERHRASMSRPEVREEISNAGKGRHHSPETREKLSAAMRGRHPSPETRAKLSAAMRGRHHSPETREKLRQAHLGKYHTPETREKLSAAMWGKHPTLETRAKIGAANLGKHHTPETRERMSGERNPNWNGGSSYEPYCPKFNEAFKERVRSFWGRTCCLCLAPENGQRLSVHHVHANKEACCDERSPRQFVALCASCHSKIGGARKAKAEEYRIHFQEMIALRGGRSYLMPGEGGDAHGSKD
jgi:hypothetical protein